MEAPSVSKVPTHTVLWCDCGTPWAYIKNGILTVRSRHHGEVHTNQIAIAELVRLAYTQSEG